jgi:hypothetical protein
MDTQVLASVTEDWNTIVRFLPSGWKAQARRLGAIRRSRKFGDAELLLRTLFIHLADGCSLRETSVRAQEGGLVAVSDVALMKRLRGCSEWFRWMATEVMKRWITTQPSSVFGQDLCVRLIDGSTIQEPGATGSTWKIHYSIQMQSLSCDEVLVTDPRIGETLLNFSVRRGDLVVADRGYAHRKGIAHVVDHGGNVLVRLNLTNVPLVSPEGAPFPLLEHLRTLQIGDAGDWEVVLTGLKDRPVPIRGRVCAIKKDKWSAERARQKVLRENGKKAKHVRPETVEAAGYVFVLTTLGHEFSAEKVTELYRGRWQIELVFKRLKSILSLGHLKKIDLESAKSWIHGKLLVAFLIEAMLVAGERFFPWGYPLRGDPEEEPMPVAGASANAAPL